VEFFPAIWCFINESEISGGLVVINGGAMIWALRIALNLPACENESEFPVNDHEHNKYLRELYFLVLGICVLSIGSVSLYFCMYSVVQEVGGCAEIEALNSIDNWRYLKLMIISGSLTVLFSVLLIVKARKFRD
jgi:hypothetical protein